MLQSNRLQSKSKAALGLLLTIFVAAACSHKNDIKEDAMPEPVASTDQIAEPAPSPVFATEPDSVFEESKTESIPEAPIAKQKIAKHKISKRSHKKHRISRHHRKNKKIAKNHKRNIQRKSEMQPSTAAGTVNQLPPPPPAPPQLTQTPPPFADAAQLSQPSNDSAGFQWLYIGTGFAIALAALGYRYRGRITSKKSRRLIFN